MRGTHAHASTFGRDMQLFIGVWFTIMCFWWLGMNLADLVGTTMNYAFGFVFGLIPFAGGIIGLVHVAHWGGRASVMGRATSALSFGLLAWSFGSLIWAYYNFFGAVDVPYPSLADAAYIVSWPLWAWGMVQLSLATGAKFSLRRQSGRLVLLLIPLVVLAFSYILLVTVARGGEMTTADGGVLKVFFDLAYPMGDVVILSLSLVIFGLSFKYFGGIYRTAIYVLLAGFVLNYFADFAFSWTTLNETFFVGGWVDGLFMCAMTALALGVAGLDPRALDEND